MPNTHNRLLKQLFALDGLQDAYLQLTLTIKTGTGYLTMFSSEDQSVFHQRTDPVPATVEVGHIALRIH